MATRARHGTYLFQRPDSANWYVRLRSGGKRIEQSLGTSDRRQAEILALPMVADHKRRLLAARPRVEMAWIPRHAPGLHVVDGERLFATTRDLHYLDDVGAVIRTEPNGGPGLRAINIAPSAIEVGLPGIVDMSKVPTMTMKIRGETFEVERPNAPRRSGDDGIMQTYFEHRKITGYERKGAESVWALYQKITENKPLKDATRDDGRKLVQHFIDAGNSWSTVKKKVGWLRSAVELAIDEGRLKFNPFRNVIPKGAKGKRLPLDDDDMKACQANLDKLRKDDALLFRLLACTGMRLSEAFEISGESTEGGIRYVIIGEKTEQSKRRVPLPAGVLPYLPKKITGHLFGEDNRRKHNLASDRLSRFLRRQCGITNPAKVIHSLRHRAQDRLRAAGCPSDIREALLGHEKKTVAAGYGVGFPVPMLRKWIDKIGL